MGGSYPQLYPFPMGLDYFLHHGCKGRICQQLSNLDSVSGNVFPLRKPLDFIYFDKVRMALWQK